MCGSYAIGWRFAPNEARYKVYVIDEVHMLSTSAFNALLKTLEEPPPHVIFILATTEPHKIPATVLSRCQRFDFHRISARAIADQLTVIAQREGIVVTDEALAVIARSATGSMRDAISLFDQITAYGHEQVDADLVRSVLGMVSGAAVSDLVDAIAAGDPAIVLGQLHHLIGQGVEMGQLVAQLIDHLRTLLLLNVGRDPSLVDLPDAMMAAMQQQATAFQSTALLHAIRTLNEASLALKTSLAGYLPVELALLDCVGLRELAAASPQPPVSAPPPPASAPVAKRASASAPSQQQPTPDQATTAPVPGDVERQWRQIINEMRHHSPRTQAMLRSGTPLGVENDRFIISFQHDFHREQVLAVVDAVAAVVSNVLGRPLSVELIIASGNAAPAAKPSSTPGARNPRETVDPLVRVAVDELGASIARIEPTG